MKNDRSVFDLFVDACRKYPDKAALICKNQALTYSELLTKVQLLGKSFLAHGIGKGTHLCTILHNSPELVALIYASHMTGAVIIPVNFRNNPFELEQQLRYAKCSYVFYEDGLEEMVQAARQNASKDINWVVIDGAAKGNRYTFEQFCALQSDKPFEEVHGDDNAVMLFSGGTTGISKLAVHTHRGIYNWVTGKPDAPRQALPEDVFLMSMPMCHSAGLGMLHDMLSNGSTVIISGRFSGQEIIQQIEQYSATQMFLIPPTLCRRLEEESVGQHDLSTVRMVTLAGGTVTRAVIECCFRLFPNAKLCVVYSHSERAAFTMQVIDRSDPISSFSDGCVGFPYMGCEICLRDRYGKPVPDGQPGIAWAHSASQMTGYLNSEERFVDGWLNTGDILSKGSDGQYIFLSRAKDCIKSGGENVFASELEQVISACDGVVECVVLGMPDDIYHEIVAAAVISDGTATAEAIISKCRERLASYKKPRKIYFVDSFPRTAIGKVNKRELAIKLSGVIPNYTNRKQ